MGLDQSQAGPGQWHESVFVDGAFRKPRGRGTLGVRDKASGEIFASPGLADQADVDAAVTSARIAQADSALRTEEIFAPIAPIVVVADADEAVALANDTKYGLVNSVVTADLFRGSQLGRRLRAGMVHVNEATPQDEATAPFGGIGQSGLGGRPGGDANLEEFTERRWLTINPGSVHYPY